MRWLTPVLISLLLLALTPPANASTAMVYRTEGTVLASYCDLCPYVGGTTQGTGNSMTVDTEDGVGQVVIPGALQNGGNYARLDISGDTLRGRYAEVSLVFYSANGHVLAHFDEYRGERGCIPDGAAYAVARLDLGLLADFTYTEFNTTMC